MSTNAPDVRVDDDASGMAEMLAGVLRDNLQDYAGRARVAGLSRGSVVFRAADRDQAVTLSFGANGVDVHDGAEPGAPEISGSWLEMTKLCTGQSSPLRALRDGTLQLNGAWRPVVGAAAFSLSVPAAYYRTRDMPDPLATAIILAIIGAIVVAIALAVRAHKKHP